MAAEQTPPGACLLLTKLPLEIRQQIYEFASERKHGHLILKEYLEKCDPAIAPLPPIVGGVPASQDDEDSEVDDEEDEEDEEEEEDADIDMEDEDEAEGEDEGQDEGRDEEPADEEEAMVDATTAPQISTNAVTISAPTHVTAPPVSSDQAYDQDNEDASEDATDEDEVEDNGSVSEEDTGMIVALAPARRRAPPTGPLTKYRHILPIFQLSHSPPPIKLFQLCRQIHNEATAYYLNRCALLINVNKGWSHLSMFVETLKSLAEHSYGPLSQVRKVELTYTWDSEWIREKTTGPSPEADAFFFHHYLSERITAVCSALKKCYGLRTLKVHWHDTEDTFESRTLMTETFGSLRAVAEDKLWIDVTQDPPAGNTAIELVEHFSQAGTSHAKNSLLALRRTEFDYWLQSGFSMR